MRIALSKECDPHEREGERERELWNRDEEK